MGDGSSLAQSPRKVLKSLPNVPIALSVGPLECGSGQSREDVQSQDPGRLRSDEAEARGDAMAPDHGPGSVAGATY